MKRFITLLVALFTLSVATAQSEDYAQKGYDHEFLRNIFSVNREVALSDLENIS